MQTSLGSRRQKGFSIHKDTDDEKEEEWEKEVTMEKEWEEAERKQKGDISTNFKRYAINFL